MTGKGTYFRVGLFVLASLALIVVGVIAFGVGLTGSRAAITVETYVNTSGDATASTAQKRHNRLCCGIRP